MICEVFSFWFKEYPFLFIKFLEPILLYFIQTVNHYLEYFCKFCCNPQNFFSLIEQYVSFPSFGRQASQKSQRIPFFWILPEEKVF